jgi:hypothetical protein
MEDAAEAPGGGGSKDLTEAQRAAVVRFLYERAVDGKPRRGSILAAAEHFRCHRNTIHRIWARRNNPSSQKKSRVGRKAKYLLAEVKTKMEALPQASRQTVRATAALLDMPKSSFADLLKTDEIRACASRIKPLLTQENKHQRLDHVLQFVRPGTVFMCTYALCDSISNENSMKEPSLSFHDFYDHVHIDEKWFFIDKDRRTFYLTDNEQLDHRATKSKRFLTKVMFLVAVARPRWDTTRNQWFDGRIGIWPCVETQLAKRNSKNRPAGTPLTVPVNVDRVRARKMLVDQVIPAIKRVWPGTQIRASDRVVYQLLTC